MLLTTFVCYMSRTISDSFTGIYDAVPSKQKSSNRDSGNRRNYRDRYLFLVRSLFDTLKVSKNELLPRRRRIRALLVNGILIQQELQVCSKSNGHLDTSNGCNKSLAFKDLKKLMNPDDNLVALEFSRKWISDDTLEDVVKFILSADNIKTISWGSVDKLCTTTETIALPKLQ